MSRRIRNDVMAACCTQEAAAAILVDRLALEIKIATMMNLYRFLVVGLQLGAMSRSERMQGYGCRARVKSKASLKVQYCKTTFRYCPL